MPGNNSRSNKDPIKLNMNVIYDITLKNLGNLIPIFYLKNPYSGRLFYEFIS